jgi:hypothetical protein
LIRYDSETGIREGKRSVWNARSRAYSLALLILFSFFIYTLFSRPVIETSILRTPGLLYQENGDGRISNVYNIKIVNKTHEDLPLELRLLSHEGDITMAGSKMEIADQDRFESTFILYLHPNLLTGEKTDVVFGVFSEGELIESYKSTFIGP